MSVKTAKIELEVCDVDKRNAFVESVGKNINGTFKKTKVLTLKEDKKSIYIDLLKLQKSNFLYEICYLQFFRIVIEFLDEEFRQTGE